MNTNGIKARCQNESLHFTTRHGEREGGKKEGRKKGVREKEGDKEGVKEDRMLEGKKGVTEGKVKAKRGGFEGGGRR